MPATKTTRRPRAAVSEGLEPEAPLPQYSLPVVLTAFAAGVFLGTRTGRHLAHSVVRAGLLAVKPALLVGGLFKLREFSSTSPSSPIHRHES